MLADKEGDGDAFRVPHIKKIDPENTTNLVQVPESILTMELAAYTKKPSFPVEGWKSLEKYHNGARYGAKILEQKIPGKEPFFRQPCSWSKCWTRTESTRWLNGTLWLTAPFGI